MLGRLFVLFLFAGFGGCCGLLYSAIQNLHPSRSDFEHYSDYGPAPHHVPPQPGGVSFRFAMLHDILHERYPKHGTAYYQERERRTRAKLAATPPDVQAAFLDTDDLAIALARLGRHDEAILLLREKLKRQTALKIPEHDKYTTYANLGSFLMEASEARAAAGGPATQGRFAEGVSFAKRAVAANPNAHFGRESWQVQLAEFLRLGFASTESFGRVDFLKQDFSEPLWSLGDQHSGFGRAASHDYAQGYADAYLKFDDPVDDPTQWERLKSLRKYITRLKTKGLESEDGVPFDEPMLAIVGIWRQTPTASPHLAVAIGETMLRVGQRNIAWSAFERAARTADPFPALRLHCLERQKQLEEIGALRETSREERLRLFEAELAYGENYQQAYQEFEANQIAKGVVPGDPDFYKEFHTGREPIASPSGVEERIGRIAPARRAAYQWNRKIAWTLIGAAIGAGIVAAIIRIWVWWAGPDANTRATKLPNPHS